MAHYHADKEIEGIGEVHQSSPIGKGKQADTGHNQPGDNRQPYIAECDIIDEAAQNQCMQIPVRSHRMEEYLVEQYGRSNGIYTFAYGQEMRHHRVGSLHAGIRDENPEKLAEKAPGILPVVGEIARKNQESGHVERIDDLFRIRILVAYIYKVEDNHQGDEDTFQIIYLFDAAFHEYRVLQIVFPGAKIAQVAYNSSFSSFFRLLLRMDNVYIYML